MIALTFLKIFFLATFALVISYALFAFFGIIIPHNRNFRPSSNGVTLYLSTNGMHTDFVLPTKNELFDWTQFINKENFKTNLNPSTFLGIGWGDRAIYLDIAEWSEVTFKMGLKTLLLPTDSILHVTAYESVPATDDLVVKKTTISNQQYLQLCQFILTYFKVDKAQNVQLIKNAGYTENDNFYHANRKYHALFTCNTWVNKGLKIIGVRTPLWTPVDKGIFYQFEKIKS